MGLGVPTLTPSRHFRDVTWAATAVGRSKKEEDTRVDQLVEWAGGESFNG